MKINQQLLAFLLFLTSTHIAWAQFTIPVDLKQASVTAMPTGPHGFVVFDSLLYQKSDDDFFLKYTQYDTSFVQKWEQFIYFQEGDRIVSNYNSGQHIYLLFQTLGDYIRLSRMDAQYGAVDTASFILPEKFEIRSLHGLQEHVWVEGVLRGAPAILKLNLFTRLTELLPLNVNQQAQAQVVSAQVVNNEFQFIVTDRLQRFNRLVVHRLEGDEYVIEPIDILSKTELSRIQLLENSHIIGQYGRDDAKADGLFTVDLATKSYVEIAFKDIWGEGKASLLGTMPAEKAIARSNNAFLIEEVSIKDDSIILWLEVFQQKFRSKNQTEKEIERDYRDFENFMTPGSFFGSTAGYTGSGTQRIEMRSREAQINNAIATGFEYVCHIRVGLTADSKIGSNQKYITKDVEHLSTLNNTNVFVKKDEVTILGYYGEEIRSFDILGNEQVIFPQDGPVDQMGRAKITHWYNNTFMLRTYFRKEGQDYYTLQALKLK
ncbi:MAG: hypothetical protein RIF33_21215 [Cyclobacteriaceae bacterium]